MTPLDWAVLGGWLAFVVVYGTWRGRGSRNLDGYLLADRDMRWSMVALSVMATQASAITFLSTPGQGYADGMRFLQFYLGLPIAMVVLCVTVVPIYHRLKVYTAYEYLGRRFDPKTRTLAATLFLVQRGLAAGLTIYAPALILSVLLGWDLHATVLALGGLVVISTAAGGARAVGHTHVVQFLVILGGMAVAFALVVRGLPAGVGVWDAARVAGTLGRLRVMDYHFDVTNRYNFWSGLIGGGFLALSYFGTDQSQVGRYLTGRSVAESRLGLLFNGMVKVPMQFGILFLGAMLFAFYLFVAPPLWFNPVAVQRIEAGVHGAAFRAVESRHAVAAGARAAGARRLVAAQHAHDPAAVEAATRDLRAAQRGVDAAHADAAALVHADDPKAPGSDTNYVFLAFVLHHLPSGVVGLVLAAIFAASMNSTASELNALASTTVVDVWKRLPHRADPRHEVTVSRIATVVWGGFAVCFAETASRLGSLIEAVNILGSLFYGTILGIFLVAFYAKHVGGSAVFIAAVIAEAAVLACFKLTPISFLWYNVVGCLGVVGIALVLSPWFPTRAPASPALPA